MGINNHNKLLKYKKNLNGDGMGTYHPRFLNFSIFHFTQLVPTQLLNYE